MNRAIDVRLRGQVKDDVRRMLLEEPSNGTWIAHVDVRERMPRIGERRAERFEIDVADLAQPEQLRRPAQAVGGEDIGGAVGFVAVGGA